MIALVAFLVVAFVLLAGIELAAIACTALFFEAVDRHRRRLYARRMEF